MIAAYILAGELHRSKGQNPLAFRIYQELFGSFVLKKQQAALRFGSYFVPRSSLSLFMRNQIMNLMRIPWIADRVVGRDFADKIAIPQY